MPQYKKRKHSRLSSQGRVKKTRIATDKSNNDIKMNSAGKKSPRRVDSNMKLVRGRRDESRRRLKVGFITVSAFLIIAVILQIILPAGLLEGITSFTALMGSGSYPIELSSNETASVISRGSYYYVLSNTNINAFTNSGKELFSYTHGFERPVLKVSSSRALVFEQGGTEALLFNIKGLDKIIKTEKGIISAGVSDSGVYSLATFSDKYASAVSVYSKKHRVIYEWYSAENTVNNVAISPNGKKIAVSAFGSSGGKYRSVLSVLKFKSADADYTETFENSLIYNLDNTFRSGFGVVTENGYKHIRWGKYKSSTYKNDYSIKLFRSSKSGSVAVFNRESDNTDNNIVVFSKTGKKTAEFKYNGLVSDIMLHGSHIYCMNDTEIIVISKDGDILRKIPCGFGTVKIHIASENSVILLSDNKIEKAK